MVLHGITFSYTNYTPSPDVGKVLRWDPEKGITDTSFSYIIECAQEKQVSVRVRFYDLSGNVVYEVTEQKMRPGGYSFPWDGTANTGDYGYPPEEGSNIAPSGLYTFDVEVEANPLVVSVRAVSHPTKPTKLTELKSFSLMNAYPGKLIP